MVLAFAHQLADRLPGMLENLVPAVEEAGRAGVAQMDMDEAFET